MSIQQSDAETQLRQQRAQHVFQEMLTAVSPEVRSALESLYDLVQADLELCRCSCSVHAAKHNP